jgi:branched-chain amino acid transport system ATP-binding protein
MLKVDSINVFYGAIQALRDVSLSVDQGEIVSIIGSNGAGKSTLMRTLSGLIRSRTGSIAFLGEEIRETSPDTIVRKGLSQSPEGRKIFTNMTVYENLLLGATIRNDDKVSADIDHVFELFPRLLERKTQNSGTLSGGEQQMLAIGRALMARPKLLLLDEPSMGLAPNLVAEIFVIIERLKGEGVTILLVEQNAHKALQIADRAYVLETGKIVLEGPGQDLLTSSKVREAYLGGE